MSQEEELVLSSSNDDSAEGYDHEKELARREARRAAQGAPECLMLGQPTQPTQPTQESLLSQDTQQSESPPKPAPAPPRPAPGEPTIRPGERFALDQWGNSYVLNSAYGRWMQAQPPPNIPLPPVPVVPQYQHPQLHQQHHPAHAPMQYVQAIPPAPVQAPAAAKKPRGRPRKDATATTTTTKKKARTPAPAAPPANKKEDLRFSDEEKVLLSKIVLDLTPLGPQIWEAVAGRFNQGVQPARQMELKDQVDFTFWTRNG